MAEPLGKLGEKIFEARNDKRMNQLALATLCDVTQQTVSRWENGTALPTIENLQKVAQATGRSMAWFFEEEREDEATKTQEEEMKAVLMKLVEGQERLEAACLRQEALLLEILKEEEIEAGIVVAEIAKGRMKK